MFKLLMAYDGSDCSDKALYDLKRAGLPAQGEALVLAVADVWADKTGIIYDSALNPQYGILLSSGFPSRETILKDARALAQHGADMMKKIFPKWEIRAESAADSPGWGVIEKTEAWKPDLAVLGSHGRSAAGRILFGSVSHKVLAHARVNLRISRAGCPEEQESPPLRIVAAFDGSQESETAFRTAIGRNWPKGTAIRIITVMDERMMTAFLCPSAPMRYWMKNDDTDPAAWVERMMLDQKKAAQAKGLIVYTQILKGDPKRVLLKESEAWGADTIFVGSRGLSSTERIIVGSVSMSLATHAHCAVEVVHQYRESPIL